MIIEFELQGKKRVIKYDGHCYQALKPDSRQILGYYSILGNAILSHIRDCSIIDSSTQEEVISLKEYVARFEKLLKEIRGLSKEDIFEVSVFESDKKTSFPKSIKEEKPDVPELLESKEEEEEEEL
jgi:hypothetical protein